MSETLDVERLFHIPGPLLKPREAPRENCRVLDKAANNFQTTKLYPTKEKTDEYLGLSSDAVQPTALLLLRKQPI